ncbi:MAG: phosphate ABC transporter permease PstA [Solirubrobacteraceae bacterium]
MSGTDLDPQQGIARETSDPETNDRERSDLETSDREASDPETHDPFAEEAKLDPARPLTTSSNGLRRRQLLSRLMQGAQTASAGLAIVVLGLVLWSVASRGSSVLSLGFLTKDPPAGFEANGVGGIAPAIVGTALMIAMATAMALPIGMLTALYLTEFADRRVATAVRLALDILVGVPSIVIGLFVFGLLVYDKHQSGFYGSVGLAIIMLPVIARAAQEVLMLVPSALREASQALGMSHWRTVRGVVLPSALGGILTATVLAVARAAGETAPLLFASSLFGNAVSANLFSQQGIANIPVYIYEASNSPSTSGFARAWGAAFVLLLFILITSLAARTLMNRRGATTGLLGMNLK